MFLTFLVFFVAGMWVDLFYCCKCSGAIIFDINVFL